MGLCTALPNAEDIVLVGSLALDSACVPFPALSHLCSRHTSPLSLAGSC